MRVRGPDGGYISVSLPLVQVMVMECKIVKADDEGLEASGAIVRLRGGLLWGWKCGDLGSSTR